MNKRFKLFFIPTIASICLFTAFINDDWLTGLLEKLDAYRKDYPQEKVYLHIDKPYYSVGDDVWIKAYVVNNENNELSTLSNLLYVDLVDEQDSVHKTLVLPLTNGLAYGDIKLAGTLVDAGNYRLRAYTRWMQNFDSDFIFTQNIFIGDARSGADILTDAKFSFDQPGKLNATISFQNLGDKSPVANKQVKYNLMLQGRQLAGGKAVTDNEGKINISIPVKDQYKTDKIFLQTTLVPAIDKEITRTFAVHNNAVKTDVQFFPEGGRLIEGLRTKIGFKATLPGGYGASAAGRVVDQANNKVIDIKTDHAGMGVFAFLPEPGKTYTAILTTDGATESRYPLPVVGKEGYVLNVNQTGGDEITVTVQASKPLINGAEVALVAQQNGVVRYTSKIKLDQALISARISKKKFSTGIVQFTLMLPGAVPVAERLLFINHQDQLNLELSTTVPTYAKRQKVDMQLFAKDDEFAPVQGNFSLAVTDANKVVVDDDLQAGILANLLLTSDLKGFIEAPNYYFNGVDDSKARQLDNLMLTQGWRRFTWAQIKTNSLPPVKFKPRASVQLTGNITTLGNKPVPGGKVTLYASTTSGIIMADTVADETGNFKFDNLVFDNDAKFVVRAKNAKDADNVKINLNPRPLPAYDLFATKRGENYTETLIDYLQSTQKRFDYVEGINSGTIMLKEVKVNDTKKLKIDKNTVDNSMKLGTGAADLVIRREQLIAYNSLIQAFYGKAGITVKKDPYFRNVVYRVGRRSSITQKDGQPMMVILNGTSIDPGVVEQIYPGDVEAIEVLKSDYNLAVYGDQGAWGVIVITLKNGRTGFIEMPKYNVASITLNGYTTQREFYSPVYDKADSPRPPDLRSTIYWNPNIVTDTEGKAQVSFFTADEPGTYRAIAEGIDIDGRLARKVFMFTVK